VTVFMEHVHCLACGKRVSGVDPQMGLVVRAWVECPECLEAADREPVDALRRQVVALTAEADALRIALVADGQPTADYIAALEAECDGLKAARQSKHALELAAYLAFIRGVDISNTLDAARAVLVQRALDADARAEAAEAALHRLILAWEADQTDEFIDAVDAGRALLPAIKEPK